MKDIVRNLIEKVIIPKYGDINYDVVLDSARPKYVLVIYRFPHGRPEKKVLDELISDTKMLLTMLGLEDVDTMHVVWKMVIIKGVVD